MTTRIRDYFKRGDALLLVLCVAASSFGLVLVWSATRFSPVYHSLPYKQGAAILLGIAAFILCSLVDLDCLMEHWLPIFLFASLFLLSLAFFGTGYQGNKNWLEFSWLPFNIMPAEIVKPVWVMLLAKQLIYLQRNDRKNLRRPAAILQLVAHLGWFCGLIFVISGDAGSVLVYAVIFVIMCWVAGVPKRWFLLGGLCAGLGGIALWNLLPEDNYWIMRIRVVLDHQLDPLYRGWNQSRSLLAIRAGGLWGQGYTHGILTQNPSKNALPERYTDFIFSTCAEELGLLGCVFLLLLLTAVILRCFQTGLKSQNPFSALVCMGYAAMLLFQTVLNVGMCLYVLPVVGITLPFISYGGSSIITLYAAMGFVSGVRRRSSPSWINIR